MDVTHARTKNLYCPFGSLNRALWMLSKRLLFPGLDMATRKRMMLCRYFLSGDISTLDAGCGNGAFSFHAYRSGNRVLGINFDADGFQRGDAQKGFGVVFAEDDG